MADEANATRPPLADEPHHDPSGPDPDRHKMVRATMALVLLAVTAILTARCGFESSKWGGEMSISFSRASTARIEAARQQGVANNAQQQDLSI